MNLLPMNNPITVNIGKNIEYINNALADDTGRGGDGNECVYKIVVNDKEER